MDTKRIQKFIIGLLGLAVISQAMVGLAAEDELSKEVATAIEAFQRADPGLKKRFAEAQGYAVFPSVAKGAIGVGGAHGKGQVFEKGKLIGLATLTQGSIGFQLGGQVYSELIFFETKDALDSFKANKFAMSAQISAVAAAEGVSRNARYQNGVMVFTLAKQGLMYEASVGGQKFKFTPLR